MGLVERLGEREQFIGAEAGLLDGRTVTTHWARAPQLAEEYPGLTVDADPIYTHDGSVWTSAGVTAGIDLALAMVEADYGSEIAQTVAGLPEMEEEIRHFLKVLGG